MTVPTLSDLCADGALSLKFYCMNWPPMTGCGESWKAPMLRFDPDLTMPKLEAQMFCPFCRSDRIQVSMIRADAVSPFTTAYAERHR